MRSLEGNTHPLPILQYTKSTFPGLLLNRRSSCRCLGFVSKFTTYYFVHLVSLRRDA